MKKLFLGIILIVSMNLYSQDSTMISNADLNEVFGAIEVLETQDSIKTVLINDLSVQISNYKLLETQDSLLLMYKDRQIDLLNQEIVIYDDRLKKVDKWYKKPWVGFIIGCATITTSSWIVSNVIN